MSDLMFGAGERSGVFLDAPPSPRLDAADAAYTWLAKNIGRFVPTPDAGALNVGDYQRTAELALALCCLSSSGPAHFSRSQRQFTEKALGVLQDFAATSEACERLIASPAGVGLFCWIEGALRATGAAPSRHKAALERAFGLGVPFQNETVPYRLMDVALGAHYAGIKQTVVSWASVEANSSLVLPLHPILTSTTSAYGLTHAAFFFTAFGSRRASVKALGRRERLARVVQQLILVYIGEEDWDLLGELLMTWACLGMPETPVVEQGWVKFLAAQMTDGSFRHPVRSKRHTGEGDSHTGESRDPRPEGDSFDRRYHTTLVGVMAVAMAAAAVHRVSAADVVPPLRGEGGHADLVLDVRSAAERASGWCESLMTDRVGRRPLSARDLTLMLFACWLALQANPDGNQGIPERIPRIARKLSERASTEFDAIPATLKLVSASIAAGSGVSIPALAHFAEAAYSALKAYPSGSPVALAAAENCVAVGSVVGEPLPLRLPDVQSVDEFLRRADLWGTDRELLARMVASATEWGTRKESGRRAVSSTTEIVIAGIAADHFRKGDVLGGSVSTRSLAFGLKSSAELQPLCEWLLLQQKASGAFGLVSRQALGDALVGMGDTPLDIELDVHLPLTADVLWTLCEASLPEWTTYSALPPCEDLRPH